MSQKKVDYSKSLIYKIVCNDTNIKNVYIGSTTSFRDRKSSHKSRCNNETNKCYNFYVYKFIRENGGWDNFDMILIDYVPCETKLELHKIERKYIEKYDLVLNTKKPIETQLELKQRKTTFNKEYYTTNKEREIQRVKIYYENNKEREKQKAKNYYHNNKEYTLQKNKEYYNNNREKVECDICNSFITKHNLKKHKKTKKCLSHIKCL